MTCPNDPESLAFGSEPGPFAPGQGEGCRAMAAKALGRPKDMEKREAILDAAQTLFAERGVDGAPIEAIAANSGVSKVTVYAHFRDKPAMLEAIVQRETDRLACQMAQTAAPDGTAEDRLVHFGLTLVGTLSEPCHLALDRALSLDAYRGTDLARRFFDAGPGRVRQLLAETMADLAARGEIVIDSPVAAAEDLLSLWFGFRKIEWRFGLDEPCAASHDIPVRRAVKLFLNACRPETPPG